MKTSPLIAAFALSAPLWSLQTLCAQTSPNANLSPTQIQVKVPLHLTQPVSTTPTGYKPAQVRYAYGLDQVQSTGSGQTIAVVEAYGSPTLQQDLDTFNTTFNLPKITVKTYQPQGASNRPNIGWQLETSMDVQWAHAVAPDAKIIVVAAKNDLLSSLLDAADAAVKLGATQVSMTWGASEFSSEQKYDKHFTQQGVTFVASSGDDKYGVQWPAASPNVVGVGGTTLSLDQKGHIVSENAWSQSSGGMSAYETKPSWQSSFQTTAARGVPDVSYLADPTQGVAVYASHVNNATGWFTLGGTSVGASQWAAIYALAASGQTGDPSSNTSTANQALYNAATHSYGTVFRDITSGSNSKYSATVSYDYVTGLGSPVGNEMVLSLEKEQ